MNTTPKRKTAGGFDTTTATTSISTIDSNGSVLTLTTTAAEARIDSRALAEGLRNQHKAVLTLLDRYIDVFKQHGQLTFKKEVGERKQGGGNAERYALLNENQAYLLLNLSRNTEVVVALKSKLITAFSEARRMADQRQTEYLPTYHRLHDTVHQLAGQSANEKFVHMNLNKLVNKTAGLEAGQRPQADLSQQAMLIVAQAVAIQAMQGATDHHDGYQLAKRSLSALAAVMNVQRLGLQYGGQ